ncbi:MAG: protein-glutamate O-methyltransferase CheR [Bryobacter sp.]|nr:protein-glutamate O-methyltransferase CheR [Bryobacter sp.]
MSQPLVLPALPPLAPPTRVRPETLAHVRKFIYEYAGIDIPESKGEMVAARLAKQARLHQFESIEDFVAAAEAERQTTRGELLSSMIDCLTTNYTSFFREPVHFEFLRNTILPTLAARPRIQLWSAASSTGEEPYSLAITLTEALGPEAIRRAWILATDISTRVLRQASQGIYPAARFSGMTDQQRRQYLLRGKGEQAGNLRVRPELRSLVEFRRLNLLSEVPAEGPFPVIFLRNVMIYFDRPTQERVVRNLSSKLEPGGYLMIGHSESLNGIDHGLEHVQVAIYRKPGGGEIRKKA